MGSRSNEGRRRLAAAALAAFAGGVLFVTSVGRGDSGAAEPERTVVRRAQSAPGTGPSLPAIDARLADVKPREAVDVLVRPEFTDVREPFPPVEDVVLRVRATLTSGGAPPTLVATLRWDGSDAASRLEPAAPDDQGVTTFAAWRVPSTDRPCVVVLATSRTALSNEANLRVLFEGTTDQLVRVDAPAPEPVDGVPTIDLGHVVLSPPSHLGTLRFVEPQTKSFRVTIRLDHGVLALLPEAGLRRRSQSTGVRASAHQLVMSTFHEPTDWSVVVEGPEGHVPFHGNGRAGGVLDVRYPRPPGMDVVVDLVQHPLAARAVVFDASTPQPGPRLDETAYDERELGAVRIAALPPPHRRPGLMEYPVGPLVLEDGRTYRIELWSTLDAKGGRRQLASFTSPIAGDMVDVRL
ncbi:MAG: hypothetical protein AAF957_24800 [Planctomycetota bacterium]